MPTVLSLLPYHRFETARVELIPEWDFLFLAGGDKEDLIKACRGADFLLVPPTYRLDAEILAELPSLSLIQSSGSGFDQVDLAAARRRNLPVANVPGGNAGAVAELTIGLLITLQRQVVLADREIEAGNYRQVRERLLGKGLPEVRGTQMGIVGLGEIGREVARLANAMGAGVSYFSRHRRSRQVEKDLGVEYKPWEELLAESEAVSLHVPLNDQTRGLVGRRELSLLPPGALLINTARGEVVDQTALAAALEDGRLGGAAVDTLSPEPPPPGHPLLSLSPQARARLVITPHLAGATAGSFTRMLSAALDNLRRVAGGDEPANVVNGVGGKRD